MMEQWCSIKNESSSSIFLFCSLIKLFCSMAEQSSPFMGCSVMEQSCSVILVFCSAVEQRCSVTKLFCSMVEQSCSVILVGCSAIKLFCSAVEQRCSVTKMDCSRGGAVQLFRKKRLLRIKSVLFNRCFVLLNNHQVQFFVRAA